MNQINKIIFYALLVMILAFPFPIYAHDDSKFPSSLFGVELGGIYLFRKINNGLLDVGTFPIKAIKGISDWGAHIEIDFQPLKEYEAFKYTEKPIGKKHAYRTSFKLSLFPIYPVDIISKEGIRKLESNALEWEVSEIKWSVKGKDFTSSYFWAKDLCKNLETYLEKKPKITNITKGKSLYKCVFKEKNNELYLLSSGKMRYYALRYKSAVFLKKLEVLDKIQRKLQMNKLRPY